MLKAIAAAFLVAGLGAVAGAQTEAEEDFQALSDGWHLHPSMCLLHHQDESEWVLGLRYSDMTIDFDVSSRSLRGLEHGGTVELELVLDGASRPVAEAHSFVLEDGWQGYSFWEGAEMFDQLKGAGSLELRRQGQVLARVDLTGVAAAMEASKACYVANFGAGPGDEDMNMTGDYSTDMNAM